MSRRREVNPLKFSQKLPLLLPCKYFLFVSLFTQMVLVYYIFPLTPNIEQYFECFQGHLMTMAINCLCKLLSTPTFNWHSLRTMIPFYNKNYPAPMYFAKLAQLTHRNFDTDVLQGKLFCFQVPWEISIKYFDSTARLQENHVFVEVIKIPSRHTTVVTPAFVFCLSIAWTKAKANK